jgi:quercetin dioxygenase-like cupin family protein
MKMPTSILSVLAAALMLSSAASSAIADDTKITPLLAKPLPNFGSGEKEAMMLTIEYAPGASTEEHRHDAHVFVYVLEGSIVMQAKGGPEQTLTAGQTFYEVPEDVHAVSKNASTTNPAKFLVFMVKDKGKAPVLPASR